jgi:hypothetical protein
MTITEAASSMVRKHLLNLDRDFISIGVTDDAIIIYTRYRVKKFRDRFKEYEGYPVEVKRIGVILSL